MRVDNFPPRANQDDLGDVAEVVRAMLETTQAMGKDECVLTIWVDHCGRRHWFDVSIRRQDREE